MVGIQAVAVIAALQGGIAIAVDLQINLDKTLGCFANRAARCGRFYAVYYSVAHALGDDAVDVAALAAVAVGHGLQIGFKPNLLAFRAGNALHQVLGLHGKSVNFCQGVFNQNRIGRDECNFVRCRAGAAVEFLQTRHNLTYLLHLGKANLQMRHERQQALAIERNAAFAQLAQSAFKVLERLHKHFQIKRCSFTFERMHVAEYAIDKRSVLRTFIELLEALVYILKRLFGVLEEVFQQNRVGIKQVEQNRNLALGFFAHFFQRHGQQSLLGHVLHCYQQQACIAIDVFNLVETEAQVAFFAAFVRANGDVFKRVDVANQIFKHAVVKQQLNKVASVGEVFGAQAAAQVVFKVCAWRYGPIKQRGKRAGELFTNAKIGVQQEQALACSRQNIFCFALRDFGFGVTSAQAANQEKQHKRE